jgi:hypothetical protein
MLSFFSKLFSKKLSNRQIDNACKIAVLEAYDIIEKYSKEVIK